VIYIVEMDYTTAIMFRHDVARNGKTVGEQSGPDEQRRRFKYYTRRKTSLETSRAFPEDLP
jgi:hypothetical protein